MEILEPLNPQQRQAVETVDGPLLVLAGPGSGKTRVITHRIAYLVHDRRVSPYSIMAVTFTNKAAREMKARLEDLTPDALSQLTIGTFHAICSRILRREGAAIGLDSHFVIYDEGDQLTLVKKVLREQQLDEKQYSPRALLSHISKAKSELMGPLQYGEYAASYWEEVVLRVYRAYQDELSLKQAVDFDDLIMLAVRLFRERPDVLERYQSRYRYILVDEFQDTNIAQYSLLKHLAAKYRNLCVVGDEDQSVYSWRQADLRNILNFEYDYPGAKVIILEQNYRSTQNILNAARGVIAANALRKEKKLWTTNEVGPLVTVFETYNERDEARYIASQIERLVTRNAVQAGNCAVMYRTNAQSRALEEAFVRSGLPYRLVGATRFYERKEVKDVLAFLRFIFNPRDDVSLARMVAVSGRGIGAKTMQHLENWADQMGQPMAAALLVLKHGPDSLGDYLPWAGTLAEAQVPPPPFTPRTDRLLNEFTGLLEKLIEAGQRLDALELLEFVLRETGLTEAILDGSDEGEERWENVRELASAAGDYAGIDPQTSLEAFLENVALSSAEDQAGENAEATTLITLHAAKGLEFDTVFIAGAEEGLCPHSRSFDDPKQMEEERRLFYVGMTRAKKRLYIVYAFRRSLYGGSLPGVPSRFLADIPHHLVKNQHVEETTRIIGKAPPEEPKPTGSGEASFHAGDRVRHPVFGDGLVVSSKISGADEEVSVVFTNVGVKRLSLAFARLEKV
ncbi:MAG: ATP-dependent helicase [Chloroflexota bacterium]